jgi:hypothetical protein
MRGLSRDCFKDTNEKSFGLVRLFKTHDYANLPESYKSFVQNKYNAISNESKGNNTTMMT